MPNKQVYDINATWDDPYERGKDKRVARRCESKFRIKIALNLASNESPLVGPGVVTDVSIGGLRCITKHRLTPGQAVQVLVPTESFSSNGKFPESFLGNGLVKRVDRIDDAKSFVALQFDRKLSGSVEWGEFVDFLDSISGLHAMS